MIAHPLRLLICSYALSAGAALWFAAEGGGVLGVALLFWLGGAVAALTLPFAPGLGRAFRRQRLPTPADAEGDGLEASLAIWEEDRRRDAEEASRRAWESVRSG